MTAMLEYMEIIRRFTSHHTTAIPYEAILELTLLNSIVTIASFFPFTAFLGTILFFTTTHGRMELTVMKCVGISVRQLIRYLLCSTFLVGTIYITILDKISAFSMNKINLIESKITKKTQIEEKMTITNKGVWFKDAWQTKSYIIYAKSFLNSQEKLLNVRFFEFDDQNDFNGSIYSDYAEISDNSWKLANAKIINVNGAEKMITLFKIPTNLSFKNINKMTTNPKSISFWSMTKYMDMLEKVGLSIIKHKINWFARLSSLFQIIALTLLASIFCVNYDARNTRRYALKIAILIAIAFPIHFVNNIMIALGENGRVSIWIAAFSVPALTTLITYLHVLKK
jgi:lipopolysaccharide export system permease protein